jgi:hypothetical protein
MGEEDINCEEAPLSKGSRPAPIGWIRRSLRDGDGRGWEGPMTQGKSSAHLRARQVIVRVRLLVILGGPLRLPEGLLVSLPRPLEVADLAGEGRAQSHALLQVLFPILLELLNENAELAQYVRLEVLGDDLPLTGLVVNFIQLLLERPARTVPAK